jgi:uncharacterized membrane protein
MGCVLCAGVALLFSMVGAMILMTEAAESYNTDYHFWACLIFSFTLMFLFAVSTLFHSFFMLPRGVLHVLITVIAMIAMGTIVLTYNTSTNTTP